MKRKNKWLLRILIVIFLTVMVISVWKIWEIYSEYRTGEKAYNDISGIFEFTVSVEPRG